MGEEFSEYGPNQQECDRDSMTTRGVSCDGENLKRKTSYFSFYRKSNSFNAMQFEVLGL